MYLIRTDDTTRQQLGTAATVPAALNLTQQLAHRTHQQLTANGEGHRSYWLRLTIHDTTTGTDIAFTATDGGPAHPPTPDEYPHAR